MQKSWPKPKPAVMERSSEKNSALRSRLKLNGVGSGVKGRDERQSTVPLTPLPTPTPHFALDTAAVVRDVKPIAMVADAILDCTTRGELVLDAFLGSGTTLLAAERVGRVCCGIEIDPIYIDVAIRRWQKYTGDAAIHAATGKRFDEIAAEQEVSHG